MALGFAPVLWASALASIVTAGVALSFPTASVVMRTTERRYLTHLREGVGVAMRDRAVRRILLFSAAMLGLGAIDEFFPLLLREAGIANPAISVWIAVSCLGAGLASLGAYRVTRTSGRHVAGLGVGIALTLIAAAVFGGIAVPLALVGYEVVSVVQRVVLGAQLQAAISSDFARNHHVGAGAHGRARRPGLLRGVRARLEQRWHRHRDDRDCRGFRARGGPLPRNWMAACQAPPASRCSSGGCCVQRPSSWTSMAFPPSVTMPRSDASLDVVSQGEGRIMW